MFEKLGFRNLTKRLIRSITRKRKAVISCVLILPFILSASSLWSLRKQQAYACKPTPVTVDCRKSVNIIKFGPRPLLVVPGVQVVPIAVRVNSLSGAAPFTSCQMPATLTGGVVTIVFTCPAFPNPPNPVVMGVAAVAPRPAGFQTQIVNVNVNVPAGFPGGLCAVTGTVVADFSADSSNVVPSQATNVGDTCVSFVEESVDLPGMPRLDMEVLDIPGLPQCGPGIQRKSIVRVTNNDLTNSVSLTLSATSKQRARKPTGGDSGAYGVAGEGDDFVICFESDLPPGGILPLPAVSNAFDQRPILRDINIAAGVFVDVVIISNSYLLCSDGSCSEFIFTVDGQFSNNDPVEACVSGTLTVTVNTPCPAAQFPSACCMPNGVCVELLPDSCVGQGGVPLGANTICQGDLDMNGIDDSCDDPSTAAPAQACCFEDGTCQDITPLDCAEIGGTSQGPSVTCASSPCPTLGACCFTDGTCLNMFVAACASTGGSYQGDSTMCANPTPAVFVGVLLGLDSNSARVAASDMDGSGTVDGNDIPLYVDGILNGSSSLCL